MSRNELEDGIAIYGLYIYGLYIYGLYIRTGFECLRRQSNTVYGGNISCACVVVVMYVILDVIGKVELWGRDQVRGRYRF